MDTSSDYTIDLSAIRLEAPSAADDTPCAEVYDVFASHPDLPALAVLDVVGDVIGIVHRNAFMLALADIFGRALYEDAPVCRLMDPAPSIVELSVNLSFLSSKTLGAVANRSAATFVIVDEGRYAGIGSFAALLRIVTDHLCTQALEAEAAKRDAEAAAQGKSRFLANMTHELRTPLNGVIGFGQMLEQEAHGPLGAPEYKLYAKDIVDSGQHLIAIINDILDLAKLEAGRIDLQERFVNLQELTGRSLRMVGAMAAQKRIKLLSGVSEQRWTVRADERRLQQAIVNLLSNAIKFTPQEGKVGIEVGTNAGWLWIEVWDAGCGISEDDLARLFKPYVQIKNAMSSHHMGTGLGLTITRALMKAHGGDVELKSQPGRGTRARLMLPRTRLLSDAFAWSATSKVEFIDPPDDDALAV